jgi:hypothetical protein
LALTEIEALRIRREALEKCVGTSSLITNDTIKNQLDKYQQKIEEMLRRLRGQPSRELERDSINA